MVSRWITILLGVIMLTGCDMVKNVQSSTNAIVENRQAVDSATDGIRENREVVSESSGAIEKNLQVVQISTAVIRENAEAVSHSTQVIKANAAVVEAATAMMPKMEHNWLAILFVLGVVFFLFGLPIIIALHLSGISRKLSRLEKELKKQ